MRGVKEDASTCESDGCNVPYVKHGMSVTELLYQMQGDFQEFVTHRVSRLAMRGGVIFARLGIYKLLDLSPIALRIHNKFLCRLHQLHLIPISTGGRGACQPSQACQRARRHQYRCRGVRAVLPVSKQDNQVEVIAPRRLNQFGLVDHCVNPLKPSRVSYDPLDRRPRRFYG